MDDLERQGVPGPDPATADVLIATAQERFRRGEIRASAEVVLEAGEAARRAGRLDLLVEAALVLDGVPDPTTAATAERAAREALAALEDQVAGREQEPARRARLHAQLAIALHLRERFAEAEAHVEQANEWAERSGDGCARNAALHARALSIAGQDTGQGLLALGDAALEATTACLSDPSGLVALAELRARSWRLEGLLRIGETSQAGHEIDSLDVLATRCSLPLVRWNAALARAGLEQATGRFAQAEVSARAAVRAMPDSQRHHTEPLFVAQVTLIATDRGTPPPELDLVRSYAVGGPLIAVSMIARYDLEIGDRQNAEAAFEVLRPRIDKVQLDRRGLATLAAAAELAVAFRDTSLAASLADRMAPYGEAMLVSALGAVGPVAFYLSLLDGVLGHREEAVAWAESAGRIAARGGFEPWHARARLALAEALAGRDGPGDGERATKVARLAGAAAQRLGMVRLAARALAHSSLTGAPGTGEGPLALSAREREVAELVAGGSTNRAIAETLGLSERTIETHVQHILAKLDGHSRAQIAAWVAERRRDGGT